MSFTIRTTYRRPELYDEIAVSAAKYRGTLDGMEEVTLTDAIGGALVWKTDVTFSKHEDATAFFESRLDSVEYARL